MAKRTASRGLQLLQVQAQNQSHQLCTARCRATRASVRARKAPNAWCRQSSLTERERRGEYTSVGALRKQSTALVRGHGAPEWSRAAQRTRESGAKARERLARLVAAVRLYGRMVRAPVRWDRAPNAMKAAEARRRLGAQDAQSSPCWNFGGGGADGAQGARLSWRKPRGRRSLCPLHKRCTAANAITPLAVQSLQRLLRCRGTHGTARSA